MGCLDIVQDSIQSADRSDTVPDCIRFADKSDTAQDCIHSADRSAESDKCSWDMGSSSGYLYTGQLPVVGENA